MTPPFGLIFYTPIFPSLSPIQTDEDLELHENYPDDD